MGLAEQHGVTVRGIPPQRSLRPSERVRLIAEILLAYVHARRALRRAPIAAAVASLRTASPSPSLSPFATSPSQSPSASSPSSSPSQSPSGSFPSSSPSQSPSAPSSSGVEALEEIRRLGSAVSRTLALLPGDTRCLARSLVLTRMLADRGIPARLVIGARSGPDFLAHAWVEYNGHPVLSSGDGAFGRLVEL